MGMQISSIVGLVFSMIIIRIGLGITTARGSSLSTSDDTRSTINNRVPIQFVRTARHPSSYDDEDYNLNDLHLRRTSSTHSQIASQVRPDSIKVDHT